MTFVSHSAPVSATLVRGAGIVSMDTSIGDLDRGDILVRNGTIVEVAEYIDVDDVMIIDGNAMIAIPGFVDGHRHMWEGVIRNTLPTEDLAGYMSRVNEGFAPVYSAEDAYLGTLVSALGALDAGITTVFDWSHIQTTLDHTARCLEALRESNLRAVFAFGMPGARDKGHAWPDDLTRLRREEFAASDERVTLGLASLSPEHVPDEMAKAHFALAREAGAIISIHAGLEGMGEPGQIARFGREGELGPLVNLVHCNTLSAEEWHIIAETGTTVCITPAIEMQMGHGVPPIQQAMDAGVKPALGIDVETSVAGDMWTQMRSIFGLQRMNAFVKRHAGSDELAMLTPSNVLEYATMAGAASTGMADRIGSLSPGKQADIVLLRADGINVAPVNDLKTAVVLNMDARNVDLVMVGGRVVKAHGKLLGVDQEALTARLYESRDRIFKNSGTRVLSPAHRCACGRKH